MDAVGNLLERVTYDAYGEARHHDWRDVDGDGDYDATDRGIIASIPFQGYPITNANYNADADLNRDGVVNITDVTLATTTYPTPLAKGELSYAHVGGRFGYDGYRFDPERREYKVRHRDYSPVLMRWMQRDPAGYVDGMGVYEYVRSTPPTRFDPTGLKCCKDEIRNKGGTYYPDTDMFYGNLSGMLELVCENTTPRDRRRYKCECEEWYAKRSGLTTWLNLLPHCPCRLTYINGKYQVPLEQRHIWFDVSLVVFTEYHPRPAYYEMRSRPTRNPGPGQQCIYDSVGVLINVGESAGTPDRVAPVFPQYREHLVQDVTPFEKCKKGGALEKYFELRPPNRGMDFINARPCDLNGTSYVRPGAIGCRD